jgi:hypothetical protein
VVETVAAGDQQIAGLAGDPVDHQLAMAIKYDHVAGSDGAGGAVDFQQVSGLQAGEHAGAGDWKTRLAEGSQYFGGQVEF